MNKGFPQQRLTENVLKGLGFINCGISNHGISDVWRIKLPYYNSQIQVELGDYPKSNPNCGIVSLFDEKLIVDSYTSKGKKTKITFPERCIPIAWYVDNPERLQQIIVSLTHVNL